MNIFNNGMIQKMIEKALTQQLGGLPPEAKTALGKTRADVVRQHDRIEIVIDSGGDPDVEKVKSIFLDSLLVPLAQIITLFGCQVNVSPQTDACTAE